MNLRELATRIKNTQECEQEDAQLLEDAIIVASACLDLIETVERYKDIPIQVQIRTPRNNEDAKFGPAVYENRYVAKECLRRFGGGEMKNIAEEFDHPCRQTCSGWKQGYEKGQIDLRNALAAQSGEFDEKSIPRFSWSGVIKQREAAINRPIEKAIHIATQCWCDTETSMIEMDTRLAMAFARRADSMLAAIGHLREALSSMVKHSNCTCPGIKIAGYHCARCNAEHALSVTGGYQTEPDHKPQSTHEG